MDKATVKELRDKITTAITEAIGSNYAVSLGTIRFDDNGMHGTLTVSEKDASGTPGEFKRNAMKFGFLETDYLRIFHSGGQIYRLVGFNPRAKKFPCIVTRMDGTKFKMSAEIVLLKMASTP